MSTPVATVAALFAVTLFMIVSLVTANGSSNTLQNELAHISAAATNA